MIRRLEVQFRVLFVANGFPPVRGIAGSAVLAWGLTLATLRAARSSRWGD